MQVHVIALMVAASVSCCTAAVTRCQSGVGNPVPRPTVSVTPSDHRNYVEKQGTSTLEHKKDTSGSKTPESALRSKRGLAYNNASLANSFGQSCEACSWGYNWAAQRANLSLRHDFVPMLWGTAPEHTEAWEQLASDAISKGAKAIFSFNEPDNADQSDLSPSKAALAHQKYLNPFAGRVLVGAPSVSNSNKAGEGLKWLQQFVNECGSSCRYDFCNVHWYHNAAGSETLFEHIEEAHRICNGKPVWLTEFGLVDGSTPNDLEEFMRQTIPRLDKIDYLAAYSYFMVEEGLLMSGGQPSSYGRLYASIP